MTRITKNIHILLLLLLTSFSLLITSEEVDLQEFVRGNNLFTASVYKEILKENQENILVSPFSVETILSLTQFGAKDDTSKEIRSALRLPEDEESIKSVFKDLLPKVRSNEEYFLRTANRVYAKDNLALKEDFTKIAAAVYQAGVENIDFVKNEEAAAIMNKWVQAQTEDKIKNLIDPTKLDETTRLILLNALYFKGNWTKTFDFTDKKTFYKSAKPGDEVEADLMHKTDFYNYHECPELDAKFLEIPFIGKNVSMVIILPNRKDGLGKLENQVEKVFIEPKFTENVVEVSLPKFKVENKIIFNQILQNLGVKQAFSDGADLSGIAGTKGELSISDVIQKTFMAVNEEGVEAAAATFVGIVLRDSIDSTNRKIFQADHPFLFYVKVKGVIMFAGRIVEPKY